MIKKNWFWCFVLVGTHAIAFAAGRRLTYSALAAQKSETISPNPPSMVVSELRHFFTLLGNDVKAIELALAGLGDSWQPSYAIMLVEMLRFAPHPEAARGAIELLQSRLGGDHGTDVDAWHRQIWNQPEQRHPNYAAFKSQLYSGISDPRFAEYFRDESPSSIRLDEIRWGGVRQDGIPPLVDPKMVSSSEADYLAESDIIFGIQVNGESKAYPKRILAWHEMVKDTIGGNHITGVYCTLCGSMIGYRSTSDDGTKHELGTSGFLYRSNKLMYDRATQSLWSTITGQPVVGPLVGQGIALKTVPVVTSTWGKWKNDHPDTTVLSIDTGYQRDYGEGVAYRDYFASDQLMFAVPQTDDRLKAKDEVFVMRGQAEGHDFLAVATEFLAENTVYSGEINDIEFVILTDSSGASRAYETRGTTIVSIGNDLHAIDANGVNWTITEDALLDEDSQERLKRIPGHRVFWFAWFSQHPETRLIK